MGESTTGPGKRPVRPGGNRPQFGAMRRGRVPDQEPEGNDGSDVGEDVNQVRQPPVVPDTGQGQRPVRPRGTPPQHGALRGGRIPGLQDEGSSSGSNQEESETQSSDDESSDGESSEGGRDGSEDDDQAWDGLPPNLVLPQLPPLPQNLQPLQAQQQPVQPPVVSPTPVVPQNQQIGQNRVGKLSPKEMGKLTDEQRQWSDNVLRALKLKSKGSQARVLAGAIGTVEQLRQANSPDLRQAQQLLVTVQRAGDPPWKDTRKAMAATDAKMQLDLLSIPANNRQLQPLGGGGVNATFTVNRLDPDGVTRPAFLCKPATIKNDPNEQDKVDGIPDGGEVIREALSGRAAQTFASQTGIDIRMPESHVVRLPATSRPGGQVGDPDITCSIQEWGPGLRQMKDLTPQEKALMPSDQIAAIAVFDLMTLNTDRHSGNIMSDGNGGMMPIDHGCSFPQGDGGKARITETMAGPHNALLRMPGAFDPMPPDMVKKLKAMKSSDYGEALKKDRDDVAAVHPDMNGMVSDEALQWAEKAARFAKLAARNKPPLSAGAMQMAFGANAASLLAAPDFDTAAKAVIAEAAPHNDTVRAVCTSEDAEYAELCRKVKALGWRPQPRGGAPTQNALSDPLVMISIIENNIQRGNNPVAQKAADDQVHTQMPAPNAMKARLLALRKDLVTQYIALMPQAARGAQTALLNNLGGTPDQQMLASEPLMRHCRDEAVMEQLDRLRQKLATGTSPTLFQVVNARDAVTVNDPIEMARNINQLP